MRRNLLSILGLIAFAFPPSIRAQQQDSDKALYVVTHVDVTPPYIPGTVAALTQFASDSRKDAGCLRFEVLGEVGRANHFTVVEVWRNRKAFEDHLASDHSRRFREKLQPMLGSPFDERLHNLIE